MSWNKSLLVRNVDGKKKLNLKNIKSVSNVLPIRLENNALFSTEFPRKCKKNFAKIARTITTPEKKK